MISAVLQAVFIKAAARITASAILRSLIVFETLQADFIILAILAENVFSVIFLTSGYFFNDVISTPWEIDGIDSPSLEVMVDIRAPVAQKRTLLISPSRSRRMI